MGKIEKVEAGFFFPQLLRLQSGFKCDGTCEIETVWPRCANQNRLREVVVRMLGVGRENGIIVRLWGNKKRPICVPANTVLDSRNEQCQRERSLLSSKCDDRMQDRDHGTKNETTQQKKKKISSRPALCCYDQKFQ